MNNTPLELMNSTAETVEGYLKKSYPDYMSFGNGSFTISHGSTQVMIMVRPYTDQDTIIECLSTVVSGATMSQDLAMFLLRKNAELHFGAFGLLFDDTVVFSHSIAGTNADENELLASINTVAIISDYYDDEIVNMAGGKRAIDLNFDDLN